MKLTSVEELLVPFFIVTRVPLMIFAVVTSFDDEDEFASLIGLHS